MPVKREFKINNYISLKLIGSETTIYVAGEPFDQCKHLLINIPVDQVEDIEEIESIDAAAEILGSIERGNLRGNYEISPSTEFWGHCSNLQAWAEHNYDTRILHRSLAFPLLKRLTDIGDPIARRVFKEEIAKRFESGYSTVVRFLHGNKYLEYLDSEEILVLITNILNDSERLRENYSSIYSVLEGLTNKGNLTARQIIKEEIFRNFKNGRSTVVQFLLQNRYLKYLSSNEILSVLTILLNNTKKLEENYTSIYSILKELTDDGHLPARQIFIDQLITSIEKAYPDIMAYFEDDYLNYLSKEEFLRRIKPIINDRRKLKENYITIYNMLRKMICEGDLTARQIYKEELTEGFKKGSTHLISYLFNGNFLKYLTNEESFELLMQILENSNQFINNYYFLYRIFKRITIVASPNLNGILKKGLIKILKEGNQTVINFLIEEGYFRYLNKEDLALHENALIKKLKNILNKPISSGDPTLDNLLFGGFRQGLIYLLVGDKKLINNILSTTSVIAQTPFSKGGIGEAIRVALLSCDDQFDPYNLSMTAIAHDLRPHRVLGNTFLRRVFKWNQLLDILENKLASLIDLKLVLISDISILLNNQKSRTFEELIKLIQVIKNTRWTSNPSVIMLAPIDEYQKFDTLDSEKLSDSGIVTIKIVNNEYYTSYTVSRHPWFPNKKRSYITKLKI